MIIEEIKAFKISIPLDRPYVFARGSMEAFESVLIKITTKEGLTGYGESVPLPLGESSDITYLSELINGILAPNFKGQNIFNIEYIVARALELSKGNVDAIAGIDLALWDLMGKCVQQPVYQLIGGLCQEEIMVDYTLSADTPLNMADKAKEMLSKGFLGMIVKVLGKSVQEDLNRVRVVRGAVPDSCRVSVDCNACYNRPDAFKFLRGIKDLKIEIVEQPVAAKDFEGMRLCREIGIPIVADESLVTPGDAITIIKEKSCDIMNIKVPKAGGLLMAKRIAGIASSAGIPVICGGRTTLDISRFASRHFAASTYGAINHAHVGPGPASQALNDDIIVDRTTADKVKQGGGVLKVDRNPGLGFMLSWEKVEQYCV